MSETIIDTTTLSEHETAPDVPETDNELAEYVSEATDPAGEETIGEEANESTIDYEALIAEDIRVLKSEFPELASINDVTELNNPLRYAALRDMGLTPTEAYLATARRRSADTRSHLTSVRGRSAVSLSDGMSQQELAAVRDLFPGKNDSELRSLYKRVTK